MHVHALPWLPGHPTASASTSNHTFATHGHRGGCQPAKRFQWPNFCYKTKHWGIGKCWVGIFFAVYNESISRFSLGNPSEFCKIPLKDNKKDSSVLGEQGNKQLDSYCTWDSTRSTKLSSDLITDFLLTKVYSSWHPLNKPQVSYVITAAKEILHK